MDVKVYYQKLRQVEAGIKDVSAVVVSLDTPDGGRAGVVSEAPREVAAKMVVEGRGRLATREEVEAFRKETTEARRVAEQRAAAARMQVTVLSEADLRRLRPASERP